MSISERLIAEFEEEFPVTRKFLDLVPDDRLGWKPHEKSMELGRLAWHVANFPQWCREVLGKDLLTISAEEGERHRTGWVGKKRSDIVAKFDSDMPEARTLIANASDAHLAGVWRMEREGRIVADGPRLHVLRKMVFNHMIHHRAQLGVYFRLNNIAIPGAYGPSADERPGSGVDHR